MKCENGLHDIKLNDYIYYQFLGFFLLKGLLFRFRNIKSTKGLEEKNEKNFSSSLTVN